MDGNQVDIQLIQLFRNDTYREQSRVVIIYGNG